jgi:integrase
MNKEQPAGVALATCLTRYYEHQAKALRSADQARHALIRWNEFFGPALVSEITAERQRAFVAGMRDEGLSEGYIRRTLAIGKAALNRAVREGEIASAPHVALLPEADARDRVLSLAEGAALFRAAAQPHELMYLALAFGTGARPEAILQLTSFQIDVDRRLINLNPPGRRQNKKRRPTIPICDTLLPLLRHLPAGPVVQYQGRALGSIRSAFARLKAKAGITDISPYTIRHTVATEPRMHGVSVWDVAGFLGHSSGYKTTERYAKFGPDHLSGAIRAIDTYFADLMSVLGGLSSDHPLTVLRASCVLGRVVNC